MKISITKDRTYKILAVAFWLLLWQFLAIFINSKVLIASPIEVIQALSRLMLESSFWVSIFNSMAKITTGFLLALSIGGILAVLSSKYIAIRYLLSPVMACIKAVPVASFVILALIWLSSKNLSVFISFLMVLPIVYTNTCTGIENTDLKLLEMGKVFNLSIRKKIKYIYIPNVLPYFLSAAKVGVGLCWKSGIAAEVIGLPQNSIGASLYQSKIFLETENLFAWTLTVVLISVLFEKIIIYIAKRYDTLN